MRHDEARTRRLARRQIVRDVFFSHLGRVGTPDQIPQFADFGLQQTLLVESIAGIETLSLVPVGGSAETFEKVLRRDYEKWADVVKATGVKGE